MPYSAYATRYAIPTMLEEAEALIAFEYEVVLPCLEVADVAAIA